MTVDVLTTCHIARAPDVVSAYAVDPDKACDWYANIRSAVWKTPPPLRIGSQIAFAAEFMGRRLEYTYEVVQFEPGALFVMRTAQGPFPMETTYGFEPAEGGTRMTLRNRGEPSGFSAWMAPLMSMAMRQANRKDLQRLKDILERN